MRALEKSTGKTSGELEKMMEQGQLTTEYIKPLVMAMGELAEANGAYEKALKKLGTVENRLKTTAGLSAAKIAEAGFTKGLINLYETLMKAMNENGATLTRIGKIYEKVFNAIAFLLDKVVAPAVELLVRSLDTLWQVMKWGVDNPLSALSLTMGGLVFAFKGIVPLVKVFGKSLWLALKSPYTMLMLMLAAIDEIRAIFDPNLIGVMENEKASQEDRNIAAAYAKQQQGIANADDLKLLSGLSKERIIQAQNNSAGLGQILFSAKDGVNPVTQFGKDLGSNIADIVGAFKKLTSGKIGSADMESFGSGLLDLLKLSSQNSVSNQITMYITSSDPEKAGQAVVKELNKLADMQAVQAR